jgi:hypothetical protein
VRAVPLEFVLLRSMQSFSVDVDGSLASHASQLK